MKQQIIWFLGDSWSVPNYCAPVLGYRAKYHVSEILADLGHTVTNLGLNGMGNGHSVNRADSIEITECPDQHPHASLAPDWIIWFHTAIIRDCDHGILDQKPYSTQLGDTAHHIYNKAAKVMERTGAKLILIEGHAPVYEPVFSQLLEHHCTHIVRNWRGQILGQPDLPQSHWYSQYPELEYDAAMSLEEKEAEIHKLEQISDAIGNALHLFPDRSHPGDIAYIQLTAKILQIMMQHSEN